MRPATRRPVVVVTLKRMRVRLPATTLFGVTASFSWVVALGLGLAGIFGRRTS
jgi:hypothetical protein